MRENTLSAYYYYRCAGVKTANALLAACRLLESRPGALALAHTSGLGFEFKGSQITVWEVIMQCDRLLKEHWRSGPGAQHEVQHPLLRWYAQQECYQAQAPSASRVAADVLREFVICETFEDIAQLQNRGLLT